MLLGRLEAESRRQTEIMLGISERLIELPDRMMARLMPHPTGPSPEPVPPSPPAAPPMPATSVVADDAAPPSPLQRLGTIRDWITAVGMVTALLLVLSGKMTGAELVDLARTSIGLPPPAASR